MSKNKTRTTYGVYNLIEWQAILKMGKATVKVPFTGGAITTQGVTPATYTTEDPIIQFAIESSPEFKGDKIKVVRRVKIDGVVEIERNPVQPDVDTARQFVSPKQTTATEATDERPSVEAPEAPGNSEVPDNNAETLNPIEKPENVSSDDAKSEKTLIDKEFACNDDAKDYLEQTFGCVRSKLHNRAEIIAVGKANGVNIIFS